MSSNSRKITFLKHAKDAPEAFSDAILVAACAQGDVSALGTLFDRHHLAMYRFINSLISPNTADVDDILQNTFMTAYESAHRFAGRSTVQSWLFGIAINSVRRYRRQSAQHTRNLAALAHTPLKEVPSPHDTAESKQQVDRLNHAIAQLPSKYRDPFVLCEIEGLKGAEAAEILGLREGTLWRRLHTARKTLARAVKRQP